MIFSVRKAVSTAAVAILLGTGALIATSGPASARIVCNSEGDCWYTEAAPPRVPGIRFTLHPNDWYFHQHWDANHHYREYHEGRGYWKGGVWITL
jgi:hypothetical protein